MIVRRLSTLAVAAVIVALGVASLASAKPKNYRTHLAGQNEVPPVRTLAVGEAVFQLNDTGDSLRYKLNVANIDDVRASHIHVAAEGVNGPVAVFLFAGPPIPGRTQGTLAQGVITAANLIGPLQGGTLGDLIEEIEAGNTYVNVHTDANPGGEIRGQIK